MYAEPTALLRRIRLGEDSELELKSVSFKGQRVSAPERKDLADELAAMANSGDGLVVLGVDDQSREVLGVPAERLDALETYVRQICNDSIEPPLTARILRVELPDDLGETRQVLKIEVPRSLYVHRSPGGYFHRIGSSRREMRPDYLARLFQQRSQARILRFEEQAVPETDISRLDLELAKRFFGETPPDDIELALYKMRLLCRDDQGEQKATVAGLLMASHRPEEWLPGAIVQAVRYRGTRQDSNYQLDAATLTGPLDAQIRQTLHFARRNMSVSAVKDPARREIPQFSERAIFEAVVNAVAHRDYSIHGSKIRLLMYDDRLELYSPGALPNSVTVDSLALRQSTRNELLTSLLGRCPVGEQETAAGRRFFMEKRGEGVPIIFSTSRELSGRDPEYRLIDGDELLLTLWAAHPLSKQGALGGSADLEPARA